MQFLPDSTLKNIEASDIRSFPNVSGNYVQLWLGVHAAVEAKPAHGDEEGTLGYRHAESSQAALTGAIIVSVTPP